MSKKDEECEQTVCLEGDASGSYKKFAQKRFKNLAKMYQDDLADQSEEAPADSAPRYSSLTQQSRSTGRLLQQLSEHSRGAGLLHLELPAHAQPLLPRAGQRRRAEQDERLHEDLRAVLPVQV